MPHQALQVVDGLRTSGLHEEVHITTGRPGHLATEIAKSVGGVVVA